MNGSITAIVGPMCSGKTAELIARLEKYKYAGYEICAFMPERNDRDKEIESRLGMRFPSRKITSLAEIDIDECDVIAIDEAHMFANVEQEINILTHARDQGKIILMSLIDISYNGEMTDMTHELYIHGAKLINLTAACGMDGCHEINAQFNGLWMDGKRMRSGDQVVVEGAETKYLPLCYQHFVG